MLASHRATRDHNRTLIVECKLKVGNVTVSFTDLNIPVAGVPMEVTRTYDSRDKRVGDFGFGPLDADVVQPVIS